VPFVSDDRIFIEGMIFYGYHGVHPEENRLGQRFVVDVEGTCDLRPAAQNDDIDRTVNYSHLHAIAREVVEGPPVALVETLAERVALAALDRFEMLDEVAVTVRKPSAPIKGSVLENVGVTVRRRREDREE
jgi:7,8-dihydroneopterin aldolase/epimerase/oxygenase